ncbi:MAG TPA: glycosyltransferase [Solirubrobacterales bacterium]
MDLAPGSVWVDAQGAQSVHYAERGIGRFIGEQLAAVTELSPGVIGTVHLDPDQAIPAALDPLIGSDLLHWAPNRLAPRSGLPGIYHVASPMDLTTSLDDVWPSWARSPRIRTVVTLYDLIPLIFRDRYLDPEPVSRAAYFARLGLLRRADHALAISEQTAHDAVEHLGIPASSITVIDCGVSDRFSSLVGTSEEGERELRGAFPRLREGFVLYVGGDDPRKNMLGAIDGYARMGEGMRHSHQLVIACRLSDARREELTTYAVERGIDRADVLFTGFVSDSQLAALYRSCALFLFPSLYEGAGLPILEAMSCGAPVVASRTSSIPEILGDLEATFDPADPADLGGCLERVLDSSAELESLRERSRRRVEIYTWERVAERTLEGYERALESAVKPVTQRSRKRVAMLTPWPPQWSGVATHSKRLVEELRAHADIDVIAPATQNGTVYDRSLEPEGVGLFTASEFDWLEGLRDYDRVLYALGGSPYHVHAFEALMRRPGAVLAHDVRLLGLYMAVQQQRHARDPAWLLGRLREMYGQRVSDWELRHVWAPEVYVGKGIFMTREIQEHAEQLIVHSEHQRDVLRMEAPADAPLAHLVPHGVPIPDVPPSPDSHGHEGPLIVTLGIVSSIAKQTPLLLAGFARVVATMPDARLEVVGEIADAEREKLSPILAELGIEGSVGLHGRAEKEEYWGVLQSADLAVQLRSPFNAGASGAVTDCIAARVPVITTGIGWSTELPKDVVLSVPEGSSADGLGAEMTAALRDQALRARVRTAQDRYADETSFARVAERYAEVLAL